MKAIVTIGYVHVLVADAKTATKVVELLSNGLEVHDDLYDGKLVLRLQDSLRLEMKIVPDNVQLVRRRENGSDEPVFESPPASKRRLNGRKTLALPR